MPRKPRPPAPSGEKSSGVRPSHAGAIVGLIVADRERIEAEARRLIEGSADRLPKPQHPRFVQIAVLKTEEPDVDGIGQDVIHLYALDASGQAWEYYHQAPPDGIERQYWIPFSQERRLGPPTGASSG